MDPYVAFRMGLDLTRGLEILALVSPGKDFAVHSSRGPAAAPAGRGKVAILPEPNWHYSPGPWTAFFHPGLGYVSIVDPRGGGSGRPPGGSSIWPKDPALFRRVLEWALSKEWREAKGRLPKPGEGEAVVVMFGPGSNYYYTLAEVRHPFRGEVPYDMFLIRGYYLESGDPEALSLLGGAP